MTPGIDPPERLAAVLDQLMRGYRLGVLERHWLATGLLEYARDPGKRLEDCLGLSGPGLRHINGTLLAIQRNQHLARAVEAISLDPDLSTWPRCERLATHVAELVKAWDRGYRAIAQPEGAWPEWKQHLFRAWRTGRQIPATARGLFGALKKSGQSVQLGTAKLSPFIAARLDHGEVVRNPGAR